MNPKLIESMRGTPPPKSTEEVWNERCRLQEQYIEELEAELERTKQERNAIAKNTREPLLLKLDEANDRIKRLEKAGNLLKDCYILENKNWDLQTVNDWNDAKEAKP